MGVIKFQKNRTQEGVEKMAFRDIYTMAIYRYIKDHNNNTILFKDIMAEFGITYPTVRKKIKNLVRMGKIQKNGKFYKILE